MHIDHHLNLWKAVAECARTRCCFEGVHIPGLRSTELGQLRRKGTKTLQGLEQMLEAGPVRGCGRRAQGTQSVRVSRQTEETARFREGTFHQISSRRQGR